MSHSIEISDIVGLKLLSPIKLGKFSLRWQASQLVLVIRNLPDNAGNAGDANLIPGLGMRESFHRQGDKKSRGPEGERGLEYSRRKEGQTFYFFSSTFLRII